MRPPDRPAPPPTGGAHDAHVGDRFTRAHRGGQHRAGQLGDVGHHPGRRRGDGEPGDGQVGGGEHGTGREVGGGDHDRDGVHRGAGRGRRWTQRQHQGQAGEQGGGHLADQVHRGAGTAEATHRPMLGGPGRPGRARRQAVDRGPGCGRPAARRRRPCGQPAVPLPEGFAAAGVDVEEDSLLGEDSFFAAGSFAGAGALEALSALRLSVR